MKKPIEQLKEILCTVPEVEKDVKKLRFGCRVWNDRVLWFEELEDDEWYYKEYILVDDLFNIGCWYEDEMIITWNHLTLKHLMMYCNEKYHNEYLNIRWWTIYYDIDWYNEYSWISLDITKELHEQEEETLVDIINFLKG